MVGKRSAQQELFDVGNVYKLELDRKSYYGQLAAVSESLFKDEDFASFYNEKVGRPSVPPSQLALLLLLQAYVGCSDAEAVELSSYDLRWAAVLRRRAGEALCAKSTLQLFRAHLVMHDKVRIIFQKSIEEAKKTGLLRQRTSLRVAIDTKPIIGRGAVKDTYNLLGDGICRLVRGLAADAGQELEPWARAHGLARYFGDSLKGEAEIDWTNDQARREFLQEIVTDARRLLRLAGERLRAGGGETIRDAATLLETLLLQDVAEQGDEDGKTKAKIKKGTSPDRIPSITDAEQRHGHKSKSKLFTGHKASVIADLESGIILNADVLAGNAGDAEGALRQIEEAEENAQEKVGQITADCAYSGAETMQDFAHAGRDFMPKMPRETKNNELYPKSAFTIDCDNEKVTCPNGQTVGVCWTEKTGGKIYQFGKLCATCPLRAQCTRAASGRTIRVHPQEAARQEARAYQETPVGRARMKARVGIEHALARLARLGIGQARYIGLRKTRCQLLMACAVANLRRTWNWRCAHLSDNPGAPGLLCPQMSGCRTFRSSWVGLRAHCAGGVAIQRSNQRFRMKGWRWLRLPSLLAIIAQKRLFRPRF